MLTAAAVAVLSLGILLGGAVHAAAQTPPTNVRPTPRPPDVATLARVARLPSTSTRYGSGDSSVTDADFTDVTRTVTVAPVVALGPVAVIAYVSAGQLDPR